MSKQEEIHVKQRESTRRDFRLEEFQILEHLLQFTDDFAKHGL